MIFILSFYACVSQEKITKPFKVLSGHDHKVQKAFFSPNGEFIISHGWDNTVRVWDSHSFKELKVLKGHTDQVWCATVSNDNRFVASGSMDRSFIIWDMETGKILQRDSIRPYNVIEKGMIPEFDRKIQNSIYKVAFSPDAKQLAIASADQLVRIWDMERAEYIRTLDGRHTTNWMGAFYSPDGRYLICSSGGTFYTAGVKVIWDTRNWEQVGRILMSGDYLVTDNNEIGIYVGNNCMNYYKLSNGELTHRETFPDFKGYFNISPDKKSIVSCNEDSYIILRDVESHKIIWTYKHSSIEIHTASFSPDGRYLIAGTPESDILVWKLSDLIKDE